MYETSRQWNTTVNKTDLVPAPILMLLTFCIREKGNYCESIKRHSTPEWTIPDIVTPALSLIIAEDVQAQADRGHHERGLLLWDFIMF